MIATPQALLLELRARGAVGAGPEVGEVDHPPERPWFIGILLGTAGWVAGIFILIFVALLFRPERGPGALLSGAVLLSAAYGLYRADREGAFVSQLALALSIAGQFVALYGLSELFMKGLGFSREVAGVAFIALLLQVALVMIMPNALHRTMSALFACTAWALFVRFGLWDHGHAPWSRDRADASVALALMGWAVAWLPIAGVLYMIVRREAAWMAAGRQAMLRPAAVGLILGLAITTLLSQPIESFPFQATHSRGGFSLWPLLSALASIGALVGAFALGARGLSAVCVFAALLHISHFYYAMGTSLLVKALTMVVIGGLLVYGARQLRAAGRSAP